MNEQICTTRLISLQSFLSKCSYSVTQCIFHEARATDPDRSQTALYSATVDTCARASFYPIRFANPSVEMQWRFGGTAAPPRHSPVQTSICSDHELADCGKSKVCATRTAVLQSCSTLFLCARFSCHLLCLGRASKVSSRLTTISKDMSYRLRHKPPAGAHLLLVAPVTCILWAAVQCNVA